MVYEGLINTRDGEREYSKYWYVVAETAEIAWQYFFDRICEEAGEDAEFEQLSPNLISASKMSRRQGYWDGSGETFTYVDRVIDCRGLTIPIATGGAQYIDFDAENWRKKYYDFKENLIAETNELNSR